MRQIRLVGRMGWCWAIVMGQTVRVSVHVGPHGGVFMRSVEMNDVYAYDHEGD